MSYVLFKLQFKIHLEAAWHCVWLLPSWKGLFTAVVRLKIYNYCFSMLDVPLGGKVVGLQDSSEVIRFYMRCMPLNVYNIHAAYRMLAFKRRAARKRCFPSWFFWSDNNHVQRSTLFSSSIFVLVGELQNSVHPESTLKDVANLSLDAGVFLHWMLRRHRRCYSVDGNLPTINVSFQIRMFNSPAGRQILLAEDEKISHLAPGRIKNTHPGSDSTV